MIKYTFLNIHKSKKIYIPFFLIITLILFMLICAFGIHENVIMAHKQHVGKYAAIAITTRDDFFNDYSNFLNRIDIDDEFMKDYMIPKYISDYYAFNQLHSGSNILIALSSELKLTVYDDYMPFPLMIYSDISKSTHFRIGDRRITEGRFAENTDECNISEELANLNGLSIGDYIELFLFRNNPQHFKFEIVGIYEDNTEEISNELFLIGSKNSLIDKQITAENIYLVYNTSHISPNSISRNQVLTAAPLSQDLTIFNVMNINFGYDVLVYYAHDEMSMFSYIEKTSELLPEQFEIFDSGDMLRSILLIFENIESGFRWLLIFACLIGIILNTLILFLVLKDRTYDIGVFRTRGMTRTKTAVLISGETLIISIISLIISWVLYIATFANIFGVIFKAQGNVTVNDYLNYSDIMNEVRGHEIFLSVSPFEFFISLFVVVVFTVIVGLAAVLFISRHEPMKTMTEI